MKKNVLAMLLTGLMVLSFCGNVLAADKVKITFWDYSMETVDFWEKNGAEFEKANPDIDFVYAPVAQAEYDQGLLLALQSGAGPDLFALRPGMEPREMIESGWLLPLDGLLEEEYINLFDPRTLVENVSYIDGKLYGFIQLNRYVYMNGNMFYNPVLFEKAGLDPEKDMPKTFSEFREVCKKITEAGNGEFYGLGLAANPAHSEFGRIFGGLVTTATVASADNRYGWIGFDWRDGKYSAADAEHQEVVQLLMDLNQDGSLVPGWISMGRDDIRALLGQNRVAFYFDGVWLPGVMKKNGFTDLELGWAPVPVPDSGRKAYRVMGSPRGIRAINAATEHQEEALRVYKWLNGPEMQKAYFDVFGQFPSILSIDLPDLTKDQKRQLEIAELEVRTGPEPALKNPQAARVERPDVRPNLVELAVAAIEKGDMDYYIAEAANWDKMSQEKLAENIKAAQDAGIDVSMDDFIFPDWDPLDNYTVE
ncbi:MAG: extracellular solute-binding protein [bacterium]|nr:extracellular solute-binding protein [bacterium]